MNGILAAAFWASSLITSDLSLIDNLEKGPAVGRQSINFSTVQFQRENTGFEIGYNHIASVAFGPLQPSFGVSLTEMSGSWVGGGFSNNFMLSEKEFLSLSFLPGLYSKGRDVDLGGWLMFRSGIEIGSYINEKWVISIHYDHRSSGDIWEYNPGMETIQFRVGRLL